MEEYAISTYKENRGFCGAGRATCLGIDEAHDALAEVEAGLGNTGHPNEQGNTRVAVNEI